MQTLVLRFKAISESLEGERKTAWRAACFAANSSNYRACEIHSMVYIIEPPFACPCCGGCFQQFQPHKGRKNAKCPRCKARERHRLLWLYLKNKTNLFRDNLRVLHFAPEPWFKELSTLPNLDYLSADLEPGRAMIAMDITRITLPDHSVLP